MMGHDTLRKQSSGFPLLWRLLSAFVAGLLLGLLSYFLLNEFGNETAWLPVFGLAIPFLGVLGRLAAARTKHLLANGVWLGGLAWFGIWLGYVLWLMLDPTAVEECFMCYPSPPTRESIWASGFAPLILAILVFFLLVGQLLVLAGVAVTHFVLKQIADTRASSR